MGMTWTTEQQQVIDHRKRNILVSAAAGSGKTAVLVERIIKRVTEEEDPVDIDHLLVVTFTKAAAAEMRERISLALEKKREEEPDNERLERQQTLIHNAQITTIDSFCLFVVRNHFEEIDLEPNFRIADTGEIKLLEMDILKEVFEENYGKEDNEAFLKLIDTYSGKRNDSAVKDMVSKIYHMSLSSAWPMEWIADLTGSYQADNIDNLKYAPVLREIATNAYQILSDSKKRLTVFWEKAKATEGLEKYAQTLETDLLIWEELGERKIDLTGAEVAPDFEELYAFFQNFKMGAIAQVRSFKGDEAVKNSIKDGRNLIKKELEDLKKKYFSQSIEELAEQLKRMKPYMEELVRLSLEYAKAMELGKKKKRIVDFSDIEHFALRILVDEKTKEPTETAKEFRKQFEEIMIDEYQDSNLVQETILTAISRESQGGHNMFMVGDVKQSIYRFRLARPELFMEKYDRYDIEESVNQRIDLYKNFRSRREVLDFTNDLFYKLMQPDFGKVAYDDKAALYCGASYPDSEKMKPEVLLFDLKDEFSEAEDLGKRQIEARMVASKIKELMGSLEVLDKGTGKMRPLRYSDIVILFRSLKNWGSDFAEVLSACGIPAHVEASTGYFASLEVQTVLSMLELLDNPLQDIPMAAVLKSPMAGLEEEELAEIRAENPKESFAKAAYEKMKTDTEGKLADFYGIYRKLRDKVKDTPIHELIYDILRETGYGNYAASLPAGKQRNANLQMLLEKAVAYEKTSYKGLFHFVRYIQELKKYDVDYGEADITGENEDVVHIMTIHKSKGLEFPVVFVSGINKKINQMDVNEKLVLHPDLGLGLDEITLEPRVKRSCLYKKQIAERIRQENLAEELRVLYVALTRAKEKLILTATISDASKTFEKYVGNVKEGEPLLYSQRIKATSYLDWLIPAMYSYPDKYEPIFVSPEELLSEQLLEKAEAALDYEDLMNKIHHASMEKLEQIQKSFSYEYPYTHEAGRKSKYSVSELKHHSMTANYDAAQGDAEIPEFLREDRESYIPGFAGDLQEAGKKENVRGHLDVSPGALRGTALHRVMECLDFEAIYDLDCGNEKLVQTFVKEQLSKMTETGQLTPEMRALIPVYMIEDFVKNDIAKRMAKAQKAGRLYKEKPFVMDYEGVLVQGIIDVFWMEADEIIVLDYKSDKVESGEELILRYQTQLEIYANALEKIFSTEDQTKTAKERLIYSFKLKEVITV
ncbi:MAG: helicase-exonuclease AddAB subunit AddA [Agathobacter sp.]|nr:helicase-exonuclease AddAB subunit AddA [Agathobacter sp.]